MCACSSWAITGLVAFQITSTDGAGQPIVLGTGKWSISGIGFLRYVLHFTALFTLIVAAKNEVHFFV